MIPVRRGQSRIVRQIQGQMPGLREAGRDLLQTLIQPRGLTTKNPGQWLRQGRETIHLGNCCHDHPSNPQGIG